MAMANPSAGGVSQNTPKTSHTNTLPPHASSGHPSKNDESGRVSIPGGDKSNPSRRRHHHRGGEGEGGEKKPPLTNEQKTRKHFKSLASQVKGGYYANAVRMCDKIIRLNEDPTSIPEALQTKLFCLLHLERYTEALSVLDEYPTIVDTPGFEGGGGIERAYALYRLGKEAEDILPLLDEGVKPNVGRGGLHLRAQLSYRRGDYEDAVAIYNELLDSCDINSEEHKDTETNLVAAQAHLDFERSGFKSELHTIDVSRLEEGGVPSSYSAIPNRMGTTTTTISTKTKTSRGENANAAKKKEGQQEGRKEKVEVKGLDPERWIKKSERESYQLQMQRTHRGKGGATQGSRVK